MYKRQKLNRDYGELRENMNIKRIIVNTEYIVVDDDKHVPVGRINVLVVAEYCDNDVLVITNTDGDFIKNTKADLIYDKTVSYTHLDVYKRQI